MNLKPLLLITALVITIPESVLAQSSVGLPNNQPEESSQISTNSSDLLNQNQNTINNNDTNQDSTGVVNQVATYNVGHASSYEFRGLSGLSVRCPKPAVLFSGGGGFGNFGANYQQFSVALVVPLGGNLKRKCKALVEQIVKEQKQHNFFKAFEYEFEIASRCTSLKKAGAVIDITYLPALEICQGVDHISSEQKKDG